MKKITSRLLFCVVFAAFAFVLNAQPQTEMPPFKVQNPNTTVSPYTGMTRQHWKDAARYLLEGAFSYIKTLDDPMKFPKQLEVAYPRNEGQVPTEKLEGLCRTLFMAAPLLKEEPNLTLNGINVAEYYRHQLVNLITPGHPSFIRHRGNGGASQILVEFGGLGVALFVAPEVIWEPLTKEQKDALAATMISYGDGPTVPQNWRYFNIFVLSFFKSQGYEVNEKLMLEYLNLQLGHYDGAGWYDDSPNYDYYSMWAFQMYGPLWAHFFGNKYYPEIAAKLMDNFAAIPDNYPYMFDERGHMILWGRSITYRFAATIPLGLTPLLEGKKPVNYGWMRRIASSTLLQFMLRPEMFENRIPSLGMFGAFTPAVQAYSCRGSVFWMGKAFLSLIFPEDSPYWTATEDMGAWKDYEKNRVYNYLQHNTYNLRDAATIDNLASRGQLITNYPNSGASEIRSWCNRGRSTEAFRFSENYNKLSYNSLFAWMADGKDGEVSQNFAVRLPGADKWQVIDSYADYLFNEKDGSYRRTATIRGANDGDNVEFRLLEIPLPDGILRIDNVRAPKGTQIRLGHYSLPQRTAPISKTNVKSGKYAGKAINNGEYQLAMFSLYGWDNIEAFDTQGLHPETQNATYIRTTDIADENRTYITLELWKKGAQSFTKKELKPIKNVVVKQQNGTTTVTITYSNGNKLNVEVNS